jgi:hypothetical protein
MKKSVIFKTLATIAAMLCLTTFVSCDNDEEIFSQPVYEPEYVKAEVSYTVTLSEDFFLFYDVTAAVCINEKIVREMDINECDWDYNDIWKGYVPENFFCKVVAKVKDSLPEIDPEKTYHFNVEAMSNLQLFDKAGTMSLPELDDISKAVNERMSLKGEDKVKQYIEEYLKDEVVILLSSYTIK